MERLISIHQVLLKPLVEMMFRELSALLTSNKCLPQPVVGECLGMTDFSSDPLLELLSVLCHGAVEAHESIKLCIKKKKGPLSFSHF